MTNQNCPANKFYHFQNLWNGDTYLENVFVDCNSSGVITRISNIANPVYKQNYQFISGATFPGITNSHSHAFQYAMAGLAEGKSSDKQNSSDNFWSWRTAMYKLALSLGPEDIENIATKLYLEMLKNGYTAVAEFHYLHHQPDGQPYNNPAEISQSLIRAAKTTGIKLTLIPVYYNTFSFTKPAIEEQKRFIFSSPEKYLNFLSDLNNFIDNDDSNLINLGFGAHSLRAVPINHLQNILSFSNQKPFHIHISEQTGEVNECLEVNNTTPIKYLSDNVSINQNFNFVHATHANKDELKLIHQSKANIVICPTTEANLGDGIFPLQNFTDLPFNQANIQAKSRWSIGSDSHISICPFKELKLLEYSQRLKSRTRNTLCKNAFDESGNQLFNSAIINGAKSVSNNDCTPFSVGSTLDSITFPTDNPMLEFNDPKKWLSLIIFSNLNLKPQLTLVNGKSVANNEELNFTINKKYQKTIQSIYQK